jgi:hypothetical protein
MLQTTAVRAYARVEELRAVASDDDFEDEAARSAEHETPYSVDEESEYTP